MKKDLVIVSVLAVLGLTACERTLDVGEDNASTGQVKNSVLQVRTRGASGDGATVAYPVAVYVFEGDECKASQTIGDEGQTLNIALTEGTYSVYAVGGVSAHDIEYHANIADGINGLMIGNLSGVQAIYDANGRKLSKAQRGVNIFLMSDGTKRKVLVK